MIVAGIEETALAREDPQLKLRLTDEMKERVTDAARSNGRSVNAEIVARLEESFENANSAERVARLELERKHLVALYSAEEEARKVGDRLNRSAQTLLFLFSDMVRQYADGDRKPLERFVEQAKSNPQMLAFEMPQRDAEETDK